MFWPFKKKQCPVEKAISNIMKARGCSEVEARLLKVEIIKYVREDTRLGLREAKTLVDSYF